MMWRSIRNLVFVFGMMAATVTAAEWGNVKGRFVFDGNPPKAAQLVITKDAQVCGVKPLFSEELVVNPDGKGIQNVIVSIVVKTGSKIAIHPDYDAALAEPKRIDNLACRFEPHVVAVRPKQKFIIGNKDPVGHNSKVDTIKNTSINPLIPANQDFTHEFTAEESYPAKVSCSIHPWMSAWVIVKDHPYVAVTDAQGNFEMKNVPVGEWTFHIWQEKAGHIDNVKSGGKSVVWRRGRTEWKVKAGDNDLGEFAVAAKVFEKK